MIIVNIQKQILKLYDGNNACIAEYPISSALKGLGEIKGSEQTPRGEHTIYAKYGDGAPPFSIFRGRVATGEIWSETFSDADFILSRILWLTGPQTPLDRYIYIHGTHDEKMMGVPKSHGCIRMRNKDVIDLFKRVSVGESVFIKE
ncbi:MAG: L,D-transpeptidase [Coxiellaceae bacterium]|nr:L,D-transpeptidase [Coxiellaceae bacterium]